MMNHSGDMITGLDSNSREKCHVADASQGNGSMHASFGLGHVSVSSSMGSKTAAWSLHRMDNGSSGNRIPSNFGYYHNQQTALTASGTIQDKGSAASHVSSSAGLGTTNRSEEYTGYTSYASSADPYAYGNTGYHGQGYYYGYQQQTNPSYSQQVGAYQTSGAPYQSLTSFQNTSSYVAPTSYSGTYYNTGDYQTSGGYQSSSYANQANLWNDGNYGNYLHHHYSSFTSSDSNGTYSTSIGTGTSMHYQQHYKQWADYYIKKASEVSCAPGTENISVTTTSTLECPIPGISGGYASSNSQPPPPGISSWRPDSSSSQLPSLQASVPIGDSHDGYCKHETPGFQNKHPNQMPSYFLKPPAPNPIQNETFEDKQKPVCHLVPNLQDPANQVSQTFPSPLQTVPPLQPVPTLDACRVSMLQIPTNPRIASSLLLGMAKVDKDSSAKTDAATKPAYVGISLPKPNNTVSSHDVADAMLKPGMFPASLRAYVERALARCKDDGQKAACQNIMKEMITKASSDGTLFSRNWDTEPLFRLPNLDSVDKCSSQTSLIASSLPKYKSSSSRRTKSRWEPVSDEKLVEKLASVIQDPLKDVSWDRLKERVPSWRSEIKEGGGSNSKFFQPQQQSFPNKNAQRPIKKQKLSESSNAAENSDASSDSDKEHGLTGYYSSAIALANSPEEKKKRENRSKRFEKGHGHRTEIKHFRPQGSGAENLYARRTNALLLSKNHDDGGREVEDIDWDALTVKGTCEEIEKRYLRLTSAPDPSTVRPEEVLEKALFMVQNSQKNYLYKCDQLKSIRQDLTVQRIRNELTVKVYETHARLALEAGDLPEYNQCQSQLKSLYMEGIKGCNMEFSAYNLLCVILHLNNNRDLLSAMARLSAEAKQDEAVKHALAVRSAVTSGNYILFFRLYKTAPNLATCLMDLYMEKMRFEAVKCMSRSYRPTIPVTFIAQVLGFTNFVPNEENDEKDTEGVEECEEWLKAHGASIIIDNSGEMQLDTKVSSPSLYMPDPEDAVTHGDASLAVNDFLTRTS